MPAPVDGPTTGGDRPILECYLAGQRATLLGICARHNGHADLLRQAIDGVTGR